MTVVAAVAILAIVGLCLWLLFRRGSINDRAEVDVPLDDRSGDDAGDEPHPPAG